MNILQWSQLLTFLFFPLHLEYLEWLRSSEQHRCGVQTLPPLCMSAKPYDGDARDTLRFTSLIFLSWKMFSRKNINPHWKGRSLKYNISEIPFFNTFFVTSMEQCAVHKTAQTPWTNSLRFSGHVVTRRSHAYDFPRSPSLHRMPGSLYIRLIFNAFHARSCYSIRDTSVAEKQLPLVARRRIYFSCSRYTLHLSALTATQ